MDSIRQRGPDCFHRLSALFPRGEFEIRPTQGVQTVSQIFQMVCNDMDDDSFRCSLPVTGSVARP